MIFLATVSNKTLYSEQQESGTKPNVLFLFADDFNAETFSFLGHPTVKTPTFDKLADEGVVFTNAYIQGSWVSAVCLSSRSMLNTGLSLWHAKNKVENAVKKQGTHTNIQELALWAQRMKKAGYTTYFSGKWHVPNIEPEDVFDRIGKYYPGGMPPTVDSAYDRPYENKPDSWSPSDRNIPGYWENGKHRSEIQADIVIDLLSEASKRSEPFFIYAAFNAPHDPRQSPKEFLDEYPLDKIDVPKNFLPEYTWNEEVGAPRSLHGEKLAPFPRTEFAIKTHRKEYDAIITHLDSQIARILDALRSSGKIDNTYIVFAADNGMAMGEHGLMAKQSMYEHSLKVPLFVIGRGIPKAKQIKTPVYLHDIVPTILEIADADYHDAVDFQSLLPLIHNEKEQQYQSLYGAYQDLTRMVRRENYKLIVIRKAKKILLFDIIADPWEMNDLSEKEENIPLVRSLFQELQKLQIQYNDTLDIQKDFPQWF
ncbi:MAG: sulfatase-like hydrolase/transferase [Planctomycetaceae bacterium]|nr:sulfatase-like hydrolase/transferase [Planctomycetaceae bacterium]